MGYLTQPDSYQLTLTQTESARVSVSHFWSDPQTKANQKNHFCEGVSWFEWAWVAPLKLIQADPGPLRATQANSHTCTEYFLICLCVSI